MRTALRQAQDIGWVAVDSELFVSGVKAQGLPKSFRDGRSPVAQRDRVAVQQTKPEMARTRIKRAQRSGFDAD